MAMEDVELAIAEMLHAREPYNQICQKLHVSPNTISKVKKKIDAGIIVVDESGKATRPENSDLERKLETEENAELVYKITRSLGYEDTKEALQEIYTFIVKLTPYMIYYGIDSAQGLIDHFELEVRDLKKKIQQYETEHPEATLKRLGISSKTFQTYSLFKKHG